MNIKILDGISINQNVIILVLCYIGVLYADDCRALYVGCVCWFIFVVAALSTIGSLCIYTYEYIVKKYQKAQTTKLYNKAMLHIIDGKIKSKELASSDINDLITLSKD